MLARAIFALISRVSNKYRKYYFQLFQFLTKNWIASKFRWASSSAELARKTTINFILSYY